MPLGKGERGRGERGRLWKSWGEPSGARVLFPPALGAARPPRRRVKPPPQPGPAAVPACRRVPPRPAPPCGGKAEGFRGGPACQGSARRHGAAAPAPPLLREARAGSRHGRRPPVRPLQLPPALRINFAGNRYENVSTNLTLTECDVSSLSVYGDYILRVRAESENNHSGWVTVGFKPMDDTVIGPPDIKVKSESGSLHVDFIGPFAEGEHDKWSLKQYYGSWNYRILYWKKGSSTEVTHLDTKHNSEILSKLEPWTIYCIQVQAVIPEWNKAGQLSGELCEQTTHNGVTPVWIIVTVLIGSTLVVVISVPVCFFSFLYLYRLTKHVFCPSYIFPQHLKEFLSKPPSGSQFFSPLPQEEHLFYDKLTVISEESKNQSAETGDEANKTTEHLQDSEQENSDSRIVPASEKA
ncbi:interleukin-10 receptor subunit beta isoform X1 [Ciconia boyciana]|uniref:interleukin-10 receptor subunit beta isoform X1 n=1 Tax=Ciconia boyciana TaxID=52775 RepID=UPI003BA243E2